MPPRREGMTPRIDDLLPLRVMRDAAFELPPVALRSVRPCASQAFLPERYEVQRSVGMAGKFQCESSGDAHARLGQVLRKL